MVDGDDVLSSILDSIHVRAVTAQRSTFTAPQVLDREPDAATLYVVLRGSCNLQVEGQAASHSLQSGDLALLPLKTHHTLSIEPECREGRETEGILLRVTFIWEEGESDPISSMIPPVVVCPAGAGPLSDWLLLTLSLIDRETTEPRQGMQIMLSHLARIIFVHAIRSCLPVTKRSGNTLLDMIADPQIGPALALIHTRPEEPWSVTSLARTSAMSRSAFASRFVEVTGQPPMQYVLVQRMRKACALLRETKLSVKAISDQAGYSSEAAFSHAFKKWVGISPVGYRASNCSEKSQGRPA